MGQVLPKLDSKELGPTRDRLRDAALVLGSLQRAFLPKHPRDWQHGLEVTMRGLSTQAFAVAGEETRATIDLVRDAVRLDGNKWALADCDGPELLQETQVWLQSKGVDAELEEPKFAAAGPGGFDKRQARAYAEALWWLEERFRILKAGLSEVGGEVGGKGGGGVTSPILLYPHHFDLSLVWFPHDDERQLSLGFSTGDETVAEPYLYLGAYPEPDGFTSVKLPAGAWWQTEGFTAAILPYGELRAAKQPEKLLERFAAGTMAAARPLLG